MLLVGFRYDVPPPQSNIPLCVGVGRGGLLTWLEWLFCSCAIICGGTLGAVLQPETVLHMPTQERPHSLRLSLTHQCQYMHTQN